MTEALSPFSSANPKLQIAWDSTSFRALMFCPRSYEYGIIEGYGGSGVDLEFGRLAHSAKEVFDKARLVGRSRDEAQLLAVKYAVENSGSYVDGVWAPWGGEYREQWRCTGTEPYKNEKGNKAKCPWSHAGKWSDMELPSTCGECGSPTERALNWIPQDKTKDRYSLVRLVAWYCEEQPEGLSTGVSPYAFPDGTPAVELSFKIPLPFKSAEGVWSQNYILCGHLDGLVKLGEEMFVSDLKTTKKGLGQAYFAGFSPSIQFDIYDLAGSLLFPDLPIKGLMVDAAQVTSSGARFGKGFIYHRESQREELLDDLGRWLEQAERYAANNHWPMNRANCWICQFKKVCALEPEMRKKFLDSTFEKRKWNPLEER